MHANVGCRQVRIVELSGAEVAHMARRRAAMGCNVYDSNRIYLKRGMPCSTRAVTLLHELLHDIDSSYSMRLSEEKIDTLATALTTMLRDRDNTPVVEQLIGRKVCKR